ncbi:MAG TPA: RagB/SusD family nutrient uptake outer membrane protein [Puia sp.]|nr:RagB/SusD family nutrient uptake outer membrane protein [Puia sp.]
MKKTHLVFSLFLALSACSKSDKGGNPSGGTGLTATISTQIAKTDSLSSFNKFLKAASLTDAEVAEGITVFAPSNNAFGNAPVDGSGQLPDASVLRDYIVKGVLKEADFTKGKTLTSLSGKTLTVSVVVDPVILVNGMIITMNVVSGSDKYVVYSAAQLLNAPAPVFITVWDATKWSSAKPKGETVAGASVYLFKTAEAFASNAQPDYTGTTAADGVAVINGVKPGNYFVAAGKGTISNNFALYTEKVNGAYLGYAADTVLDQSGNFIWKDVNMDSKVDANDKTAQPALTITTEKSRPLEISVLIGSYYKRLTTFDDVQAKLNEVYNGLTSLYQSLVIMDGSLSDDAGCSSGPGTAYCPFDAFTMTPVTSPLNAIWSDAYFKGIHKLNDVIKSAPGLTVSQDQVNDLMGQALTLRAWLYLELATYFGDVPVSNDDISTDFYPDISRAAVNDVYSMIQTDLNHAAGWLPTTRPEGKAAITRYAAVALLAKAALQQKQYSIVLQATGDIKNSYAYTLASSNSYFTSQNTGETIWAPAFSNIGTSSTWYFDGVFGGTQLQWCPVIRYADVLLMDAEAQIANNNLTAAQQDVNLIRARDGQGSLTFATAADANEGLQSAWQLDKTHQGDRYANLVRWDKAAPVLGASWHAWNIVMPVPQSFISSYHNMIQNVAY